MKRGTWVGVLFIVLGILVLLVPDFLKWLVAIGFIVYGILELV